MGEMTVDDPSAFVASESAREAVAAGIATAVGVSRYAVEVQLSLGRRLSAQRLGGPRQLQGTVTVEATIQADSTTDQTVANLQAIVDAVDPADIAAAITTELEERPWLSANVAVD